jgi:hypothetical protein
MTGEMPQMFHPMQEESACRLRVKGCLYDYVGGTTGLPRITADLLQCPDRQRRADAGNATLLESRPMLPVGCYNQLMIRSISSLSALDEAGEIDGWRMN